MAMALSVATSTTHSAPRPIPVGFFCLMLLQRELVLFYLLLSIVVAVVGKTLSAVWTTCYVGLLAAWPPASKW